MTYLLLGGPQYPKARKIKELTESENQHFGDRMWKNLSPDSALIGILNSQILPNNKYGKKNFDL